MYKQTIMKLVSILSIMSLVSTVGLTAGFVLNLAIMPLFATASTTLLLLTWTSDYRAPYDYAACTSIARHSCHPLPLAA